MLALAIDRRARNSFHGAKAFSQPATVCPVKGQEKVGEIQALARQTGKFLMGLVFFLNLEFFFF